MDRDDDYDEYDDEPRQLEGHESALIRQDLRDLERFEETFAPEGFRGVSLFCHDCEEDHFYPWEMLRQNLTVLLETGETPVHEPAFSPDPDDYVPWDYARGYVDALSDVGARQRRQVGPCPRCGLELTPDEGRANFCPRCGTPLLRERLRLALGAQGLSPDGVSAVLREIGLPD